MRPKLAQAKPRFFVLAADMTIGCLYNFVAAGRVLFYQCGFGSPADRQIRPGYLCHAAAVEHSAKAGLAIYDLLGGDARYKKSLATDETRLMWGRVQRKQLWFALEDRARDWVRKRANGNGVAKEDEHPAATASGKATPNAKDGAAVVSSNAKPNVSDGEKPAAPAVSSKAKPRASDP